MQKLRLGIVGNGRQVRTEYLPYLDDRYGKKEDVDLGWIGGCRRCSEGSAARPIDLPCRARSDSLPSGLVTPVFREPNLHTHEHGWKDWLRSHPVDAVVISLPNYLHANAIAEALGLGVHVAVDKPTAIRVQDCIDLVRLADEKRLVFVTMAQRRYERVYQEVARRIQRGDFGEPWLATYTIAHEFFERNCRRPHLPWEVLRDQSGGGPLMQSGYHGIDAVLWMLRHDSGAPVRPVSVSARCLPFQHIGPTIERAATCRITLENGALFEVTAGYCTAPGSIDESVHMYGSKGAVRIQREKLHGRDQSAARLSYQPYDSSDEQRKTEVYDTSSWRGTKWAPLDDFLNACVAQARSGGHATPPVVSPARDSVDVIRIIEAAYQSAQANGMEIEL